MTTTVHDAPTTLPRPPQREPWWSRALRGLGWVLIASGVVVGLFVVYLVWWTDLETARAQGELVDTFDEFVAPDAPSTAPPDIRDLANIPVEVAALPPAAEADEVVDGEVDGEAVDDQGRPLVVPADPGDAYALIWFQRGDAFILDDGPVAAVEGVTLDHLSRGIGHYPFAAAPGQAGNAAFAGHRTTYGRPFHNLDQLEEGDEVHVLDNAGRHWVYDFVELAIVDPDDTWVVEPGAVEGVSHLLTFTSCHPKYSARQRIVAFAELRGASDQPPGDA